MADASMELVPEEVTRGDLRYLANYQIENQELVDERAAGSIRIQEDLIESEVLGKIISSSLSPDQESAVVLVPLRQQKILSSSRRLGGMASPTVFN